MLVTVPSGKVPTTAPVASSTAGSDLSVRPARRVVWASFVGTALESYDFYVFAYFAAFFVGPLFFEPLGAAGATLAAFLTIAVAFVIRPVGAIVFGHLGDRLGRRRTLIVTITMMGVATGLIGVLPTYAQAGWFAAVLLVLLRLVQGISLGGEWGGAVALATEHAPAARRGLWAAFPQLGSPVGSILSAVVFLVMTALVSTEEMVAWGWRIPLLTAFPLLLVSLYLRWSIDETPAFRRLQTGALRARLPLARVLRAQPAAFGVAILAALLGIGSYSLMNTYTINYGASALGFSYGDLLTATTIGGLLQLVTIPLFGWWATRIGSARVVAIGAVGTLVVAFPIYFALQTATFGVLVGMMIVGGILPTLSWAALGGLMSDLFAARYRYSALAVAYSLAAMLTAFVPTITELLGQATADAWWHPGVVLAVLSVLTLVGAVLATRLRVPDEERVVDEEPETVAA